VADVDSLAGSAVVAAVLTDVAVESVAVVACVALGSGAVEIAGLTVAAPRLRMCERAGVADRWPLRAAPGAATAIVEPATSDTKETFRSNTVGKFVC
jgi:hypothetical protein